MLEIRKHHLTPAIDLLVSCIDIRLDTINRTINKRLTHQHTYSVKL